MAADPLLKKDKLKKPDLPAATRYRCNNCKRHRVVKQGTFWVCSRLTIDPDTGDNGCGCQFVDDVYAATAELDSKRKEVPS